MWERTPPKSRHLATTSDQNPQEARPGQIYLSRMSRQQQQTLSYIQDLKQQNEQINLKMERNLKFSRQHLRHPQPQYQNNYHAFTLNNEDSEDFRHNHDQTDQSPPQDTSTRKSKGRSNQLYRIIKPSHLKNLQILEKEVKQPSPNKTGKKLPVFQSDQPENTQITSKYYANAAEILAQTLRKKQNAVYLPVSEEWKQMLILRHNKKINEHNCDTNKKANDNSPYRVALKHSQQYQSVYYTKQRGQLDERRQKDGGYMGKRGIKYLY